MELGLHKAWHGLRIIKQSLQVIIAHPVLLVYGATSFIVSYLIGLLLLFSQKGFASKSINCNTTLIFGLIAIGIGVYINLFFLACLAHHAMHLLQNEFHSIKETIKSVGNRLSRLSFWFVFKAIMSLFLALLMNLQFNALVTLVFISLLILGYATSLVLPILATEQTGIIAAVKRSWQLVYEFFMVFIGIFLAFSLLGSINVLNVDAQEIKSLFVQQLEILTYTIFYYEYYARPRPELAGMFSQDL